MKKKLQTVGLVLASIFTLTSCEGFDFSGLLGDTNLLGHIRLVATDVTGDQYYAEGDTISFMSTICNVNSDTLGIDIDTMDISFDTTFEGLNPGTLFIGTSQNLLTGDVANITFPFIGINLNDTIEKTYNFTSPLSNTDLWNYLDTANVTTLITNGIPTEDSAINLFVIVLSETEYYIGYNGTLEITDFQNLNGLVKGDISVEAAYLTNSMIDELGEMNPFELANIDVETYFRTVTLTGEVSSRRTDINSVIESLNQMAE